MTLTHAPFRGSPAIDTGSNALLSEAELEIDFNGDGDTEDTLETDQRGFDRIVNDTVDLGAVEIRDGETPAPTTVNFSINPTEGSEADQTTFTLTATASEAVLGEQVVTLTANGVNGDDFTGEIPRQIITIADGETTGTVELTVNDDDLVEGEETANFALENPSDGISLGANASVEFIIEDNDEELQGDFNDDGITNLNDLGIFAAAFGSVEGDSNYNASVDLTSDGSINLDDLGQLATFLDQEFGL